MTLENDNVNTLTEQTETQAQSENEVKQPLTSDDLALLKAELERLKSTNSRLLEESKKYKQAKRDTDLKLLEAEGKKDEIIQTLQKELEEKASHLSNYEQEKINERIISEVARRAAQYGCDDWDHLLQLGKAELIEYDDETQEIKGIDNFFEDALKNDRFKKFFTKIEKVKTTNSVSFNESTNWKDDPLPYLRQLKKEGKIAEYNKAVQELEKSGLLR